METEKRTVYLVWWSDRWQVDYGVDSVWTTKEAAEKRRDEINDGENCRPWIEEQILDQKPEAGREGN